MLTILHFVNSHHFKSMKNAQAILKYLIKHRVLLVIKLLYKGGMKSDVKWTKDTNAKFVIYYDVNTWHSAIKNMSSACYQPALSRHIF
jgi:hypothetical protein